MSRLRIRRLGRAFTVEEHQKISDWNSRKQPGWPTIQLALNYGETPEMFGVVEQGQAGPTLFLWATDDAIVVEPFSGGTYLYPSLVSAFNILSNWAIAIVKGQRVSFALADDQFKRHRKG